MAAIATGCGGQVAGSGESRRLGTVESFEAASREAVIVASRGAHGPNDPLTNRVDVALFADGRIVFHGAVDLWHEIEPVPMALAPHEVERALDELQRSELWLPPECPPPLPHDPAYDMSATARWVSVRLRTDRGEFLATCVDDGTRPSCSVTAPNGSDASCRSDRAQWDSRLEGLWDRVRQTLRR